MVNDIERASGIKVGSYTKAAIVGGGLAFGGPIQAIINMVLTSPQLAVPLLRQYGLLKNSAAVKAVVNALKQGGSAVNNFPANATNFGKKDVTQLKPKMGMSIEDVSKKPGAFSPKDKGVVAQKKTPKSELQDLATQEDWTGYAKAGGNLETIKASFMENLKMFPKEADTIIGKKIYELASYYKGGNNVNLAKRINGYLKNNDPVFYKQVGDRARKSGFPGKTGSIEGNFLQEQIDYLFPPELISELKKTQKPAAFSKKDSPTVGKTVEYVGPVYKKLQEMDKGFKARYDALDEVGRKKLIEEFKAVSNGKPIEDRIKIPAKGSGEIKGVVYHGTSKANAESIVKNGFDTNKSLKKHHKDSGVENPGELFASKSKLDGNDHSAGTYGDTFVEIKAKNGAKLNMLSSDEWTASLGRANNATERVKVKEMLKERGIDGAIDSTGEYMFFDTNKLDFSLGKPTAFTKAKPKTVFGRPTSER